MTSDLARPKQEDVVRTLRFRIGDVLPADDPVARWITVLAMALNDLVQVHRALASTDTRDNELLYLFRLGGAHLVELAEGKSLLGAGYDEWPEVQAFVNRLSPERIADFQAVRALRDEAQGTPGERLRTMRNRIFHYPHLHKAAAARLPLRQALLDKADTDGTIRVAGGTLEGTRAEVADEIAFALAGMTVDEFRELVRHAADVIGAFMRFADAALHGGTATISEPSE